MRKSENIDYIFYRGLFSMLKKKSARGRDVKSYEKKGKIWKWVAELNDFF